MLAIAFIIALDLDLIMISLPLCLSLRSFDLEGACTLAVATIVLHFFFQMPTSYGYE
jgi:hypothetical protein